MAIGVATMWHHFSCENLKDLIWDSVVPQVIRNLVGLSNTVLQMSYSSVIFADISHLIGSVSLIVCQKLKKIDLELAESFAEVSFQST